MSDQQTAPQMPRVETGADQGVMVPGAPTPQAEAAAPFAGFPIRLGPDDETDTVAALQIRADADAALYQHTMQFFAMRQQEWRTQWLAWWERFRARHGVAGGVNMTIQDGMVVEVVQPPAGPGGAPGAQPASPPPPML